MTSLYEISVRAQGGVAALGRIVDVLCLYDLTPSSLVCVDQDGVLTVDIRVESDARTWGLCVSRIEGQVAVSHIKPQPAVRAAGNRG